MHRIGWSTAIALLAGVFLASPGMAQTRDTVMVAGPAAVLDAPRGDSRILGEVVVGTVVEVLDRVGDWYLVSAPAGSAETASWQRGWIHVDALQLPNGRRAPARGVGRLMIRGFGHGGGLLFTARDSFEAILGSTVNSVYGAGGQIVLPNGVFAQASIDRFRKTGTRALVSGSQVFTVEIPNRLTVTPIQVTAGYRAAPSGGIASYVGAGVGWHTLEEDSPSLPEAERVSKRHVGYHVLGGVEFPVLRWVWIAGEAQWATVPKALGDTGVSAVFGEDDLGGTTFRLKLILGY